VRRRESVTYHPPPQLQAVEDRAVRLVLEDIYQYLFREAQIPEAAPEPEEIAVPAWADRGDPAASDWDEGDLTADSAWHDLDLTGAGVPAGADLVLLRVLLVTGVGATAEAYFRTNGHSNAVNVSAVLEVSDDQGRDVWVTPDASGVIEYKLVLTGSPSVDVTVGGWWV